MSSAGIMFVVLLFVTLFTAAVMSNLPRHQFSPSMWYPPRLPLDPKLEAIREEITFLTLPANQPRSSSDDLDATFQQLDHALHRWQASSDLEMAALAEINSRLPGTWT